MDIDTSEASAVPGGVVRGTATLDGEAIIVLDLDALIQQVLLS